MAMAPWAKFTTLEALYSHDHADGEQGGHRPGAEAEQR